MRITTGQALTSLCPTANFSASEENDGTNVQIYWADEVQTQPTDAEIQTEINRLQEEYDKNKYQRDRKRKYPDMGDQLDALYHAGVFPEDMASKLKAVKDEFPKE